MLEQALLTHRNDEKVAGQSAQLLGILAGPAELHVHVVSIEQINIFSVSFLHMTLNPHS